MSERNYYVICDDNCKFEAMTKEQILTAIQQAVEGHEIHDVDTGFVTKIKEYNHNVQLTFWVGTQAEYNAIEEKAANRFYIITDDTSVKDLEEIVSALNETVETLSNTVSLKQNKALSGTTDPDNSIGVDGDIYFKYEA